MKKAKKPAKKRIVYPKTENAISQALYAGLMAGHITLSGSDKRCMKFVVNDANGFPREMFIVAIGHEQTNELIASTKHIESFDIVV